MQRYASYWKKRVELFGETKAFEELVLDQALRDDTAALEMGFMRYTGITDTSGRPVLFVDPSRQDKTKYTKESMVRSIWYMVHSILQEDVQAQQHGVIMLAFPKHAAQAQADRNQIKMNLASIQGALPVRISAIHICHPPTFFAILFPIIKLFIGARLRKRIRVHSGSDQHVNQTLRNDFGLEDVPEDLGGTVQLDHLAWLKERRAAGK